MKCRCLQKKLLMYSVSLKIPKKLLHEFISRWKVAKNLSRHNLSGTFQTDDDKFNRIIWPSLLWTTEKCFFLSWQNFEKVNILQKENLPNSCLKCRMPCVFFSHLCPVWWRHSCSIQQAIKYANLDALN